MSEELSRIIAGRRSIFPKMYADETVSHSIIEAMLDNANWAPTHKFTEPWRFDVFTGNGLQLFADHMAASYKDWAEKEGCFDEAKHQKFKTKPLTCSHIISIGMRRNKVIPEFEEICSVSCAVQNMMLTAHSHGIGSYWSTGGFQFYEEAKSFFDLKTEDRLLGFLFIGVPKEEGKKPKGYRKPIAEKVRWFR